VHGSPLPCAFSYGRDAQRGERECYACAEQSQTHTWSIAGTHRPGHRSAVMALRLLFEVAQCVLVVRRVPMDRA
jgi:hypothetical protein